jgi:hypothetical protein
MSYRTQILAAVIATLTFSSAALAEVSLPAGFGI